MNQARKQLWPFFGRISTLRSVFKMVLLLHTETFPWVSHLYYVLRQPPSHNLLENPGKSLKRERLHKKLNDYKLDFEVMKQENSHFTFLIPFFEFNDFQNCKKWNIYCWILWISCLFTITDCSKLIEIWLQFPKPHNLFHWKKIKITSSDLKCLLFSWNDHMISELFKTFRNWNWKCWFWELKKIRMSRNKDIKRKIKLEMVKIIGLELTMSNYKWLMHNDPS